MYTKKHKQYRKVPKCPWKPVSQKKNLGIKLDGFKTNVEIYQIAE